MLLLLTLMWMYGLSTYIFHMCSTEYLFYRDPFMYVFVFSSSVNTYFLKVRLTWRKVNISTIKLLHLGAFLCCWNGHCVLKSHMFDFDLRYVLQLPLQSTQCSMQSAMSWDHFFGALLFELWPTILCTVDKWARGSNLSQNTLLAGILQHVTDAVGHPGIFGALHSTRYVLGYTKGMMKGRGNRWSRGMRFRGICPLLVDR